MLSRQRCNIAKSWLTALRRDDNCDGNDFGVSCGHQTAGGLVADVMSMMGGLQGYWQSRAEKDSE